MAEKFNRARRGLSIVFVLGLLIAALSALPVGADAGDSMILGQNNTSDVRTTLRADAPKASLRVVNQSGATALSLVVADGVTPFKVNSSKKVEDLNADRLDGKTSSAFAKKPKTTERVIACGAGGFVALGSSMGYGTANLFVEGEGVHFVRTASGGNFFGDCVLDIPPGAVVTEARFIVWDGDPTKGVSCSLYKVPLGGSADPVFTSMTAVLTSGAAAEPGPGTVLATTTISEAAVNPGDAITAGCWMDDGSLGIEGVAVTYDVAAVPGTNP